MQPKINPTRGKATAKLNQAKHKLSLVEYFLMKEQYKLI